MKILYILITGLILTISAHANNLAFGEYECRYDTDQERGITASRARLSVFKTTIQDVPEACLFFYKYPNGKKVVQGKSCGKFNKKYAVRLSANNYLSARFDGYEDYVSQSSTSVPPAKRRFGLFEFSGSEFRFFVMGDRRISPAAFYICERL